MSRGPHEVVIVGAGPAGAALATHLATAGLDVLLLDRDAFPRPKPCGECLNPAAVHALERLGALPAVLAAAPARLRGWRIVAPAGGFAGGFPEGEQGLALPRAVLDALLLQHARAAGAEVRTGVRVTDLLRAGRRVVGVRATGGAQDEIRARLVVGADGLRSVVLRRLGLLRRPPRLRKLALTAHVRGVDALGGRGELHAFAWGCVGIADVGDGRANVTVVAAGDEAERVAGRKQAYFDAVLARLPRLRAAVRDEPVLATGPFDWPTRAAVADGVLLVGDAAGYYDPFTGQGVYRALRGAELAAETIVPALCGGPLGADALRPYERARRRAFAPGERLQHLIEPFVAHPALLSLAARRLARSPAFADALIAVTADLAPVRSLLRPGLLARLLV